MSGSENPPAAERSAFDVDQALSGQSGIVSGWRRPLQADVVDALLDIGLRASGKLLRLDRAAKAMAQRTVSVLSVYWPQTGSRLERAVAELGRSRHNVRFALGSLGPASTGLRELTVEENLAGGKFRNLNKLLEQGRGDAPDWTLIVDDDVKLPRGFLDRFLFLAERFDLQLAQPALTRRSHAAWSICRRQPRSLVRETRFVEIGPVTALSNRAAVQLLPFPDLEMGWGLDLHWSALAKGHDWRLGIVDATPVEHHARSQAADYERSDAIEEARRFLMERPFLTRDEVMEPVARHKSW